MARFLILPQAPWKTLWSVWMLMMCCCLSAGFSVEYRSFDGTGNNVGSPSNGMAGANFIRFGYGHRFEDVVGDVLKQGLPSPRDISNRISPQTSSVPNARHLSDWVVQWGQFLSHDLSRASNGGNGDTLSTGATVSFSIPVLDPNDVLGPMPISFHRTNYDPNTGLQGPPNVAREQVNQMTAYVDGSQIYGSDTIRATALRTLSDGLLATSAGGSLPGLNTDNTFPNQDPFGLGASLFLAGDIRANENVGLTATHALFVREHNRLAGLLKQQNGNLTDEELFQLSRKIVGAELQKITYEEFLPAILGTSAPRAADYSYDSSLNAAITNSFTTAFFRFGHSMQSPAITLVDNAGTQTGSLAVRDAFFNVAFFNDPNNVDLVLKGLANQVAQENDPMLVDDLRNFLFGPPGAGGLDLAALDIQRGRDHGLPGYNSLRLAYGLTLQGFSQISSDASVTQALMDLYSTAGDIDPFIGAIAEDQVAGTVLGELAGSVLTNQFERLRDGDRFFYTGDPDLQLPDVQAVIDLDEITLSQIIELNTGVSVLQENVFYVAEESRCDFSGDLVCDVQDIDLLYAQGNLVSGVSVPSENAFDLNGDLLLDQADLTQWLSEAAVVNGYATSYRRGDSDNVLSTGIRNVDITDFSQLSNFFDPTGAAGSANTWQRGNFDGDADIDITDFTLLTGNFSPSSYNTAVPEPSVWMVILYSGLIFLAIGKRNVVHSV